MTIALIFDWQPAVPWGAAVLALLAWLWGRSPIRGTTATESWRWQLIAAWAVCGGAAARLATPAHPTWEHALSFAVATALFCPTMALLGSRRPHHLAWHLIVVSLWCVLALPALELVVLARGEILEIRDFRGWFLWALIAAELLNRWGTRLWYVGLVHAGVAVLLLAEHLPLLRWQTSDASWWFASIAVPALMLLTAREFRSPRTALNVDQAWLKFRDWFGVLWSLRVLERVNAVASAQQTSVRLQWRGWVMVDEGDQVAAATHVPRALQQTLANLLRRFLDARDWELLEQHESLP